MVSSRSTQPWGENAIKPQAEKEGNWPKDWPEHYIKVSWAGAQGQGYGLPGGESNKGLVVECSSQPFLPQDEAEGDWAQSAREELFGVRVHLLVQEEDGIFPGHRGKAQASGSTPGLGGRAATHSGQLGQGVTSQGNEWGPRQPTLCSLSSVLWFSKEGPV